MSDENFTKLEWETIELFKSGYDYDGRYNSHISIVQRARVIGGWLVRASESSGASDWFTNDSGGAALGKALGNGVGLTYIPDPNYQWDL